MSFKFQNFLLLSTQHSYKLPLRNASTKITAGPAITISATDSNWKITSQLILVKALNKSDAASNIFPFLLSIVLKKFNNLITKPEIDHIWLWSVIFNLLNKIITKDIKTQNIGIGGWVLGKFFSIPNPGFLTSNKKSIDMT